jgi:hypothetical protein
MSTFSSNRIVVLTGMRALCNLARIGQGQDAVRSVDGLALALSALEMFNEHTEAHKHVTQLSLQMCCNLCWNSPLDCCALLEYSREYNHESGGSAGGGGERKEEGRGEREEREVEDVEDVEEEVDLASIDTVPPTATAVVVSGGGTEEERVGGGDDNGSGGAGGSANSRCNSTADANQSVSGVSLICAALSRFDGCPLIQEVGIRSLGYLSRCCDGHERASEAADALAMHAPGAAAVLAEHAALSAALRAAEEAGKSRRRSSTSSSPSYRRGGEQALRIAMEVGSGTGPTSLVESEAPYTAYDEGTD